MMTLTEFAAHCAEMVIEVEHVTQHALERAAVIVETEARAEIGVYQGQAGPFAAWAELADATKADRLARGFTANDPLLRAGDMRDTIQHQVNGDTAHVGSDSDIALFQEMGTSRIPARSFLGGAAFRKEGEIQEVCAIGVVQALSGGGRLVLIE